MKWKLGLAMTVATFVSAALTDVAAMPADAQDPRNALSVAQGKRAAHHYCSKCHATGPVGVSPKSAATSFRHIAKKYHAKPIAGSLFIDGTIIRHPGMPEFEIPIEEADGLIAYTRSLGRR